MTDSDEKAEDKSNGSQNLWRKARISSISPAKALLHLSDESLIPGKEAVSVSEDPLEVKSIPFEQVRRRFPEGGLVSVYLSKSDGWVSGRIQSCEQPDECAGEVTHVKVLLANKTHPVDIPSHFVQHLTFTKTLAL